MSVQAIRFDLARMVAQAKEHLHEAEERLAHGSEDQKVRAAAQIAFFKSEQAAFEKRLAELENCPDTLLANLVEGIRKEWLIQREMFEEWSRGLRT
ncbi:MAG: hypothetical protein ACRED9_12035 [Caulobacteraceae bacterium]